ncbi:hypothetical protein LUZ60_017165 [Juncus effusus]|nr:hypothetical protein LUZ60_017165 [Juncus effusus]
MPNNYSAINSSIELQSPHTNISISPIKSKSDKESLFNEQYSHESDEFPLINGNFNDKNLKEDSDVPGAVFNLATSIIGAGIMALPATMKVLGIIVGFITIIIMGILSEISIELLVRFSVYSKSTSYGHLVQTALNKPSRIISEICIIINNAGILVVYLIIIGDVMSGSAKHEGVLDQLIGSGIWENRKLLIFIVLVIFLAPLCALEKIDSLSLTSAASVILAIVFVFVSCVIAFVKLLEGKIRVPRMGPDFGSREALLDLLVVIPIMTNAYVCHFNVQPIYNELKEKSPKKMYKIGRITTILCVIVYASTAVSGYLLFGDDTESDVLTNFDQDLGIKFSSILNFIVRIGYVLHLILVFPVIHFSLRQTVDSLIFATSTPASKKRRLCLTFVLLLIIYLGSSFIPNIWIAFKFTGATTGLALGFMFPALVALRFDKEGKKLKSGERILAVGMLVLAMIVSVIGVAGNIYSLNKSE